MNGPLKVGDLVCVVKPTPCCGNIKYLGGVFTLVDLRPSPTGSILCNYCKRVRPLAVDMAITDTKLCFDSTRLKRIPPLAELESVEREAVV